MSNLNATMQAQLRQSTRRGYSAAGVQTLDMNLGGELLVSQGLPERAMITSMGRSFSAQMTAASAFTLLITIPSTRSELTLQNPNSAASKTCLVIERFWVKAVTSMASACALTPLSQIVAGTAMVADVATILRVNLSGSSNAPSATLLVATTATGCITDKWNHHASGQISATTNIAACVEVPCFGKYIIKPGGSFNMNAQESVSGGTGIIGVEWHECEMDLS